MVIIITEINTIIDATIKETEVIQTIETDIIRITETEDIQTMVIETTPITEIETIQTIGTDVT